MPLHDLSDVKDFLGVFAVLVVSCEFGLVGDHQYDAIYNTTI